MRVTDPNELLLLLLMMLVCELPMRFTEQRPIATDELVPNSQFPEMSKDPFKKPEKVAVDVHAMFSATSFPALVGVPHKLTAPLTVTVPDAVSVALFKEVALIVRDAPVLMVRLLHVPEIPERTGWFTGAEGIVTLSDAKGTPTGDQLVDTFQAVLVVPVHVFWPNPDKERMRTRIAIRKENFFIWLFFRLMI